MTIFISFIFLLVILLIFISVYVFLYYNLYVYIKKIDKSNGEIRRFLENEGIMLKEYVEYKDTCKKEYKKNKEERGKKHLWI